MQMAVRHSEDVGLGEKVVYLMDWVSVSDTRSQKVV